MHIATQARSASEGRTAACPRLRFGLVWLREKCVLACLAWLLSAAAAFAADPAASDPSEAAPRPAERSDAWTTSRFVGTPDPPPPYRVAAAFPRLTFVHPLDITFAPGSERLFVVEQFGKIYSFVPDAECAQADLAADIQQMHADSTATYALTFHPDFARNRRAYVCYVKGSDPENGSYISEFRVSRKDPPTFDPASERVIVRWRAGGHNGCCLKFGPDGYLYISTGDGGDPSPPDPLAAGQDVTNLLSAILRIDVDHRDEGLAYRVPADNPLRDVPGARPEIWAYGFRNPWRMSFDRTTGDLWVGDVGWQRWEMIFRVERGGNYGWPIMEGPQPALPEAPRGPTPILPPVVSHPHSEAASMTGGYVYRGEQFPELAGAYVYGDFQSGKLWGLRHDGRDVTWHEELAATPLQLVGFAEDHAGELYLLDYERSQQVFRLERNPDPGNSAAFPRRLSETGLFAAVTEQTPARGVIPYEINAAHWADGATAERWMAVPGTQNVELDAAGVWLFPDGSVLAKTVGMEMERGMPASWRRLETQVLHREQGTWRPYTYVWNDEQTDAELADAAGGSRVLEIRDSSLPGGVREQTYRFASRAECQLCHNAWVEAKTTMYGVQTASPLSVTIAQLNRTVTADGCEENQLTQLARRGWIAGQVPVDPEAAPRLADPHDTSADLESRARAYLHVNCAHCHQPHAGGAATIELTHNAAAEQMQVFDVRPKQGAFGIADARLVAPGDPAGSVVHYRMAKLGGGRMPRLGSEEVDEEGVALVREWIAQMPRSETADSPLAAREEDSAALSALTSIASAEDRAAAVGHLTSSTRGALALLRLVEDDGLSPDARAQVVELAAGHPQAEVRDLFERFVPPSQRTRRLGGVVDPAQLLALPADAARGRELFFRDGAASCKSCHRVAGQGETLGPDLSEIGKKYLPKDMLAHLLEPSRFIEPKYVPYIVETTDGRVLTGLLVEQTERAVRLKSPPNQEIELAVEDVELLAPQQKSLMPDLLLRDLTPQQAADLLAFLCSLR